MGDDGGSATIAALRDQLRYRAEMERLVLATSQRFMSVGGEGISSAIDETLRQCAEFAGVEMAHVMRVAADRGTFSMTNMWRSPKVPPMPLAVREVPIAHLVSDVRIDDVADLSDTLPAKASLQQHGVRALLEVPITIAGRLAGSVGLSRLDGPHPWTEEEILLLRFFADTLSHVLRRVDDERQNEELSRRLRHVERLDAVGQLAGGVAHDFNNMLLVIFGNVDAALRGPQLADKTRDHLQQIRAAGLRCGELTRQLLAFSRQHGFKRSPLDLNGVLDGFASMLRRVIPEHIEIDVLKGHRLSTIEGDATQLEQVVLNLCLNARDAMPEGGRLTLETQNVLLNGDYIRMHPWAKAGRYVLLTVSDTGCGIPPEHLDRVFDPFFTTKPPGQGTGLGLASTYGIVRAHDGYIHVYSEVGLGTTFKLYLPAVATDAMAVQAAITGPVIGGHERILLAEDEPYVASVLRQRLEQAGYHVTCASDGHEAIETFTRQPGDFDLAVLDSIMPRASGAMVAERLRAVRPGFPIILTSGYTPSHAPLARLEGVRLLSKPFEPDELLRAIRQALALAAAKDG